MSISNGGQISYIYQDDLLFLNKLGKANTRRVSHVEPDGNGQWTAQIIGGPQLGPFKTRKKALEEEIKYLNKEMFT